MRHVALVFTAFLASNAAQAGIVDIGSMMGGANIYTLGNFAAKSSDVEGAVIAGGNVSISSYSINYNNRAAYGSHAVIAQGDIKLSGGSIDHGKMYAGGKASLEYAATPESTASSPFNFSAASAYYLGLSGDLGKVTSTGNVSKLWSGVVVSGSGKGGVDVFNVSADMFRYSSSWTLDKLFEGQTLIFNVSGANASFNDGGISFEPLRNYNVLFNFMDAETLNPRGIIGSVLAPKAAVTADWGVINGQVVVESWNSTIQVNSNHYFKASDVAGYVDSTPPADVPEPGTLALMLAGVGMAVAGRRVRNRAAIAD